MEVLLRGESFAGNAAGISLLQKSFSAGRGQMNEELQGMENISNPSPGGRGKGEGTFSRHHGKTDQQSETDPGRTRRPGWISDAQNAASGVV